MELLITIAVFGLVSGIIYFAFGSGAPVPEEAIQRRLETIAARPRTDTRYQVHQSEEETFWESVTDFFFGNKDLPERFNRVSKRLHQAGYRGKRAVRIFWGLRI